MSTTPYQRSGFANLVSEGAVRAACEEVGLEWQRPQNFLTQRLPLVVKHYLLSPSRRLAADAESSRHNQAWGPLPELAEFVRFVGKGWSGIEAI